MIGRILTHSERLAGAIRAAVGGVLMGLANLVPGISGGTMLLAAGIYTDFIEAIADITVFKFRRSAIVLLATVVGSAAVAILLLAGAVQALVINHRWIMYSLFIGLTLGGAPLVWRLAEPVTAPVYVGAAAGFVVMLLMVAGFDAPSGADTFRKASTGAPDIPSRSPARIPTRPTTSRNSTGLGCRIPSSRFRSPKAVSPRPWRRKTERSRRSTGLSRTTPMTSRR